MTKRENIVSISQAILKIIFATVTPILVLTSLVFCIFWVFSFLTSTQHKLSATAALTAANLESAITFFHEDEMEKVMGYLSHISEIENAWLLDDKGDVLAKYSSVGAQVLEKPVINDSSMENRSHLNSQGIYYYHYFGNDMAKNVLVLFSNFNPLIDFLKLFIIAIIVITLLGLGIGYFLGNLLQKPLVLTFDKLKSAINEITQTSNYEIRLEHISLEKKTLSVSEVINLTDAFNKMIEQVKTRDDLISKSRDELDIKVRERTKELHDIQEISVANAHKAGMAEVATTILHNVGNTLNSLNVSIDEFGILVGDCTKCQDKLIKSHSLLDNIVGDLRNKNISSDASKFENLVKYIKHVDGLLESNYSKLKIEIEGINKKVFLIKDVIRFHLDYASNKHLDESVDLTKIIDDSLNIQERSLKRHEINVLKKYESVPSVKAQRTKLMHVMINLIKNAKEAMEHSRSEKNIEISLRKNSSRIELKIADTGEGIAEQNLRKIFSHGFTTKSGGHGFGIHFCANAMREMNGELRVESEGVGKGAAFILSFSEFNES